MQHAGERTYTDGKYKKAQAQRCSSYDGVPDAKRIHFMPRLQHELHDETYRNGHDANDYRRRPH